MEKTIYNLGYIYGLAAHILPDSIGRPSKTAYAPQKPVIGMAQAITALHQNKKMTRPVDARIAELLEDVNIDALPDVVPIIQQGAWQKGYYDAQSDPALRPAPRGLADARNRAGLTQAQVAEQLGTRQDTVSGWENGRTVPRKVTLEKLADLYQCDVADLMG